MAYTPVNWQTGDTITAERLNRMDRGWDVAETELFSETVTTVEDGNECYAELAYSGTISADTITVTYDGTEYTCPRIDNGGSYFYGGFNDGPDFTTYPFFIFAEVDQNQLITPTAGTHTVAVSAPSLQTSADFDAARGYGYKDTQLFSETVTTADQDGTNVATLAYANVVDASTITVNFDGTEYECPSIGNGEYGAPYSDSGFDFTAYPFALKSAHLFPSGIANSVYTQTAGEHTIAVTAPVVVSGTDFAAAVKPIVDDAVAMLPVPIQPFSVTIGTTTWSQVHIAISNKRPAFILQGSPISTRITLLCELVARMTPDTWDMYTLAVDGSGTFVVKHYKADSQNGVLKAVTS